MRESPFTKWAKIWRAVDAHYYGHASATRLFDVGRHEGFIAAWRAFEKQGEKATPESVAVAAEEAFAERAKGFVEGDFFRGAYHAGFQLGVKEAIGEYFPLRGKPQAAQ